MSKEATIKFLQEWKIIDRGLAVIFAFYAHVLSADLDRVATQFAALSSDVKALNIQMVKVVERTSVQRDAIAEHSRRIEKNRDSIEDLLKTKNL